MALFSDRTEAGERLAQVLAPYESKRPLVLALPRGGVPVARMVADALHCPLDTLAVRKIGAPLNPEYAVGAIAEPDILVLDDAAIRLAGISREAVLGVVGHERKELKRRIAVYKSGSRGAVGYVPKTVILVDDGVATGMSAEAAVEAARARYRKARIVVAAPVCLGGTHKDLKKFADDVVCLTAPKDIFAIGQAYESFEQVSDGEVEGLLRTK
jgi:putative phosphoribosyl transferase